MLATHGETGYPVAGVETDRAEKTEEVAGRKIRSRRVSSIKQEFPHFRDRAPNPVFFCEFA